MNPRPTPSAWVRSRGLVARACHHTAGTGVVAAMVITGCVAHWVWPVGPTGGVLLVLGMGTLLTPALTIWLFGQALDAVLSLPEAIAELRLPPARSVTGSGALVTVWRLGRTLLAARGQLGSVKDRLVKAGALIRVASLPVLLAVLASVVVTGLLVPTAAILLLGTLLF